MNCYIALIADIHGNVAALRAVLEDIRQRGINRIINLGDSLFGSLQPFETAELLMNSKITSILGNQDRILFDPPADARVRAECDSVARRLAKVHLDWLRSLPSTAVVEGVFACHGSPRSDTEYLLEDVRVNGAWLAAQGLISERLNGIDYSVVICGHSHLARAVRTGATLIVNPGSVGLPAYSDDYPYPHVMESGSPHARYAILSKSMSGWGVDHAAICYEWDTAAKVARENGRPDRATWLATGRVEPSSA